MRAGQRRHLIRIQRRTTSTDDFGNTLDEWTDLVPEQWARVEPLAGREFFAAQQVQSETTHRVTLRYVSALSDLTPKDRILFGTRVFDIRSVLNIEERNRELHIMCTEHQES